MNPVLIAISVLGYICLKFYERRVKHVHKTTDGWNLVFLTLILGVATQIPAYIVTEFFFDIELSDLLNLSDLKDEIIIIHLVFSLVSAVLIGYLFSTLIFQKIAHVATECLVNDEQPMFPAGVIPSALKGLLGKRVLLSMGDGKVYVGLLYEVDATEKAPYENRGIQILPLKSGYRDTTTKSIIYNTAYIDKNKTLNPKLINLKLSEIGSFTEFDETLDKHFTVSPNKAARSKSAKTNGTSQAKKKSS